MKKNFLRALPPLLVLALGWVTAHAKLTVQDPGNVVGTGTNAWSYLRLEGEDYDTELDDTEGVGLRVDSTGKITSFLGNPILGTNTTASGKGALYMQNAPKHGDKVTYSVKFATPGTYYLYMRFTMFENGGNEAHYISEDSFFVPPDWGKDPQNDWPLMDAGGQNGGYTEGCCANAGYLYIAEKGGGGVRINHTLGDEEGRAYWEGNFHWNDLYSSEFLNADTQGEPKVQRKYVVTTNDIGKTLTWTISNREYGTAVDLWLFSTNPNLMDQYSQTELDQLLLAPSGKVTVQAPTDMVGTGTNAWSFLKLEGEDYAAELDETEGVGFTRVDSTGKITSFLGNPILGTNTTASGKGALYMQNAAKHADKVTYNVKFVTPGTYYLYMRFTMFENGGNEAHYISEDSFFVPPDWGKDPQNDWPLMDAGGQNGGYTEGCCANAGYLYIAEKGGGGVRINHTLGDEEGRAYWEGNFHWNDLYSSEFLNADTQGEPKVQRKYVVTTNDIGKTLTWTISNREYGTAVDMWLFSTNPNLMDQYSQTELDQLLLAPSGKVTVQAPTDMVGTGTNAWSFLKLEGEDYAAELDETEGVGFTRVDSTGKITSFLGNPILGTNTTASGKGALYMQNAAKHADKVTYNVKFVTPGTYYLYMRFTMFENGGNEAHYISEDSFFVPPDWGKDPQNDWPLMDAGGQNGGYTEGCCANAGYLYIAEKGGGGVRINHTLGDEEGRAYWEGNFHWNDLYSSEFLNADTQGEPKVQRKYVVTTNDIGKTLTWTISNREYGTSVDLWLFSTNPNLMDQYSQTELDQLLLSTAPSGGPTLTAVHTGKSIVISWPTSATGFGLESSSTLSPASWKAVTTPPVVNAGQNTVTEDASTGTKFYRLKKP